MGATTTIHDAPHGHGSTASAPAGPVTTPSIFRRAVLPRACAGAGSAFDATNAGHDVRCSNPGRPADQNDTSAVRPTIRSDGGLAVPVVWVTEASDPELACRSTRK